MLVEIEPLPDVGYFRVETALRLRQSLLRFYWEDIANDEDYKVITVKGYFRNADGSPIEMTFPDDYTVVWTSKDRGLYIDPFYMAQGFWEYAKEMMKPAHYLKAYHPKYNADATYEDLEQIDKW
ncbi:MAG: hypothetical protein JSW50_08060, partial [Candidatus Latescibacterota bacterium]